jgi:hypothetical protein
MVGMDKVSCSVFLLDPFNLGNSGRDPTHRGEPQVVSAMLV